MAVKYRNILLLFGIILVLAALTIVVTQKSKSAGSKFIENTSLRSILIERVQDTTEILLTDQGMYINPGQYPADTNAVNALILQIQNAQVGEVISERKERHDDFDVDDNALRVTLEGERSRSFYIGEHRDEYLQTYVRFAGDTKVYLARGISKMLFDRDPGVWRDDRLLAFDSAAVNGLIIDGLKFEKQDSRWFLHGQEVDAIRINEVLDLLFHLRATGFAEDVSSFEPATKVTIVSDTNTCGLEIGAKHDQLFYRVRVPGRTSVYLVNEYAVNLIRGLIPVT